MENTEPLDKHPHGEDNFLLEPFNYINSVPGGDVRGKLIDSFQLWLNVPTNQVLSDVKTIVAHLHNASLLIDDIEDNSKLRRGIPVAHNIFGVPSVINCANYVYFMALDLCRKLENREAMDVFVEEMLNLHRGQGHDIMWREKGECPSEEEYCDMVVNKTGGLFRLSVGLMQSFATKNKDTDFTPLLNKLGLYFQVRDDLINVADTEYMKLKSFCEDLTEGKFSLPVIHSIQSNKADKRLLLILKQRTEDMDVKKYAQKIMLQSGSMRYTRERCISIKNDIVALIEDLGGNPPLMHLVEKLDEQVEGLECQVMPVHSGDHNVDTV